MSRHKITVVFKDKLHPQQQNSRNKTRNTADKSVAQPPPFIRSENPDAERIITTRFRENEKDRPFLKVRPTNFHTRFTKPSHPLLNGKTLFRAYEKAIFSRSIFNSHSSRAARKFINKKSQTHSKRKPNNPTIYSQHKKTATTEGLIELNIQKTQKNQTRFKPRFKVNLPPFRDQ